MMLKLTEMPWGVGSDPRSSGFHKLHLQAARLFPVLTRRVRTGNLYNIRRS